MKIYILSSVRNASEAELKALYEYTNNLENAGCNVHLPHRDTDQNESELEICFKNYAAIERCDEVHVFYDKASQGSHFDLGMVFVLDQIEGKGKKIRLLEYNGLGFNEKTEGKSFYNMIQEWSGIQDEYELLFGERGQPSVVDVKKK